MGDKVDHNGKMSYIRKIVGDDEVWVRGPNDRFITKIHPDKLKPWESKKKDKNTDDYGTCQVCANRIGTKAGVVAHHGYRRPGDGQQTSSCEGARHLPFEISRDVLGDHIEGLKRAHEHHKKSEKELGSTNPPIYKMEKRRFGEEPKLVTHNPDHEMYPRVKEDQIGMPSVPAKGAGNVHRAPARQI